MCEKVCLKLLNTKYQIYYRIIYNTCQSTSNEKINKENLGQSLRTEYQSLDTEYQPFCKLHREFIKNVMVRTVEIKVIHSV